MAGGTPRPLRTPIPVPPAVPTPGIPFDSAPIAGTDILSLSMPVYGAPKVENAPCMLVGTRQCHPLLYLTLEDTPVDDLYLGLLSAPLPAAPAAAPPAATGVVIVVAAASIAASLRAGLPFIRLLLLFPVCRGGVVA